MGTVATSTEIVLTGTAEILGPGSIYEVRRNELRREYAPLIEAAKSIKVSDQDSAEKAAQMGTLLQVGTKESEAFFKSIKVQIDAIKAPILAAEKEDLNLIAGEKDRLARELTVYRQKVEQERQEAQRKAQAEADARAKAEREEAERQAREDMLARAVELEGSGKLEEAEAVLEEEVVVEEPMRAPVVIQAAAPPKVKGSVGTGTYTAAVIGWDEKTKDKSDNDPGWKNLMVLVKAVAAGAAPLRSLLPNESFIAGQGRQYKEGFSLPGCEVKKKVSTSFRS